jgi:hypothetical protein
MIMYGEMGRAWKNSKGHNKNRARHLVWAIK